MKRVIAPFLIAVGLGVSMAVASAAPAVARIAFDGPNGFRVQMDATFDSPVGDMLPSSIREGRDGRLHRFVTDSVRQRYFAYDLLLVAGGPDRLRVRVEPLSLSADELAKLSFVDRSWKAVPIPTLPMITDVKAGDHVVVELLPKPASASRIIDTIAFTRP